MSCPAPLPAAKAHAARKLRRARWATPAGPWAAAARACSLNMTRARCGTGVVRHLANASLPDATAALNSSAVHSGRRDTTSCGSSGPPGAGFVADPGQLRGLRDASGRTGSGGAGRAHWAAAELAAGAAAARHTTCVAGLRTSIQSLVLESTNLPSISSFTAGCSRATGQG